MGIQRPREKSPGEANYVGTQRVLVPEIERLILAAGNRYDTVVDKVKKFEVAQNFRRGVTYVTPYGNKVMRLQFDAATFSLVSVRVCLRALMHTIHIVI